MPRLKSRQIFVPGGFKFYQPETKWYLPANLSFDVAIQAIISHRKGNPFLIQQHGWPIDPVQVGNELDTFNARICEQMGWNDYIMSAPDYTPPNPQLPPSTGPSALTNVAVGAESLVEWIRSGAEAVPLTLSHNRARICSDCPMNGKGDYTRWFTIPIAQAIRREVSKRSDWKLETPFDEALNVCEACLCPLKLKVHVPLATITSKMPASVKADLDPRCWILHEPDNP